MDTTQTTRNFLEDSMYVCSHFSAATRRVLAKRGVRVIGLQAIPDMSSDMPFANAETGYVLDDNGTCRVVRFGEVLGMTK